MHERHLLTLATWLTPLTLLATACTGDQGKPGEGGADCSVKENSNGAATISCDGADDVIVPAPEGAPGTDGASCSYTDNGDGTETISCDGSESVTRVTCTRGSHQCDGDALQTCDETGWVTMETCPPGSCNSADAACLPEGGLRLTGGEAPHDGRLEIYHDGAWGTFCSNGFDAKAAQLICKELGYVSGNYRVVESDIEPSEGSIWIDQLVCAADAVSWSGCTHATWGENSCTHAMDIALRCSNAPIP